MSDYVDTCVVGGGVIGLAIARELSRQAPETLVLEQAPEFGQGVSSRNSEVIHAGIYYPKNSLKSRFCLRGKNLLYEYCEQRKVDFRNCGKLIVATASEEEEILEGIRITAEGNGVDDLVYWSQSKMRREEPEVSATKALYSPSTGIISSHQLMAAFEADLSLNNGQVVTRTRVMAASRTSDGFLLSCLIDDEPYEISTRVLINAAALGAQTLAMNCDFLNALDVPSLYFCKGSYFVFSGRNPFRHLIYPVPEKSGAGLGVHATIDMGGQLKFGPDVEYVSEEDYTISPSRIGEYLRAIRRYFPVIQQNQLVPGYAGIRPKLQGPDDAARDFLIESAENHGVPGYIQLFGIESPGLTSSMAIAEYVAELLREFNS